MGGRTGRTLRHPLTQPPNERATDGKGKKDRSAAAERLVRTRRVNMRACLRAEINIRSRNIISQKKITVVTTNVAF